MPRLLVVIAALLLLTTGGAEPARAQDGTPVPGSAAPVGQSRTVIHFFLPFTSDELNPELSVRAEETGNCDHESIVAPGRPDAWSCISAENAIYDPCFQSPFSTPDDPDQLACVASPFDREVVLLTPDRPLPVTKEGPDDGAPVTAPKPPKPNLPAAPAAASVEHGEPLPWAMLLADGQQCTLARGATVAFAGMRVNYFCSGGGMLLGEPDRTLPVWAVLYLPDGGLETDLVGVSAVWP